MDLARPFVPFSALVVSVAVCAAVFAHPAIAQGVQPAEQPLAQAAGGGNPPAAKPKAGSGDGDLRRRVEQLEEQLVDLQVVIGTLESLARSGGGAAAIRPAAPAGPSAADAGRIDALEMQIRALTSQLEQLSGSTRAPQGVAGAGSAAPAPTVDRFGSTTVNSANIDDIGSLLSDSDVAGFSGALPPTGNTRVSPAPAPGETPGALADLGAAAASGDPKQDYERAYGYLLQQNYGAAQSGFTEFLRTYPKDSLVPNALYWLGETHYVQRNYADASEAFDLVMQAYGNSPKAPDSMLKRSMSLANLGKAKDACGLLGQLPARYPSAPANLKSKADSERQRLGCP